MIPMSIPHLYDEDKNFAKQAIESGFIAHGEFIEKFENEFANFCNRKYGVTCSNGTVALYMALKALRLPENSEVILPSMTIVSCLTAITKNDLTPVFCDINLETYNIDFQSVRNKITDKTSAVIIVNTYGLVVDTDELQLFRNEYPHIKIIEDASEAHGGSHRNIIAGSIGDVSTFSFYANKIVTTGEGGIVLTDDEDVKKELMSIRNLNFVDRKKYIHDDAGFNFRMTNIQCAIGLGQLGNIRKTIFRRKEIAKKYNDCLQKNSYISIPYEDEDSFNVYWYYAIRINKNYENVLKELDRNEIDYRYFFHPLHLQPFIKEKEVLKNSESAFNTGLLLPTYTDLTDVEIEFISEIINNAIDE